MDTSVTSQRYFIRRRIATQQFKLCPLCRAVALAESATCSGCTWSGRFEHDVARVESALYEMIYRCPELLAVLVEGEDRAEPGFFARAWSQVARWLKGVDVRA